ncbi:MAG: GntG family PLP-dependent aldolase [Candidatus Electryonea clarkiae]|nr:GntG family PLP-dependent aldolase [Candidatus Electryonea clarkiae]MDP8288812.1 GntG family PLP-dependent aldolase [Candidatus Electryonea clarkiae]
MNIIDLRSDTVTKPSAAMRKKMYEAEVGDDVFGEDSTVIALQDRVAEILKKEAALYVPSGTMANQIAISVLTSPGDEVYVDIGSHIFNYESGSAGFISGVQLYPIVGTRGVFTREQLEDCLRPKDDHFPPSSTVVVENTHNRGGGTVWHLREMHRIYELTRERNMRMHLDGARLWNAVAATGTPERDWAQYADTVSVCFSKALGAPVGSAIAGTKEIITEAHRVRKRLGGGMRQAGIIAAGALYAIENNRSRLVEDHLKAKKLAEGLCEIPGFYVDVDHVDTNIVIVDMSERSLDAERFSSVLKDQGILVVMAGRMKVRMVTHFDLTENDIVNTLKIINSLYH